MNKTQTVPQNKTKQKLIKTKSKGALIKQTMLKINFLYRHINFFFVWRSNIVNLLAHAFICLLVFFFIDMSTDTIFVPNFESIEKLILDKLR